MSFVATAIGTALAAAGHAFGSGSEWFWIMLQAIVLLVTAVFVARQLATMRTASALAELRHLEDRWESRALTEARSQAAQRLHALPSATMDRSMRLIAEFFSDMDALRDRHVIGEHDVMAAWGVRCDPWWVLLSAAVIHERAVEGSEKLYLGFQDLATFVRKRAKSYGFAPAGTDEASRSVLIERALARSNADLGSTGTPTPPTAC